MEARNDRRSSKLKIVLKVDGIIDLRHKSGVLRTIAEVAVIESIDVDSEKDKNLVVTVVGKDVDAVGLVYALRKANFKTQLLSVGPEGRKKPEPDLRMKPKGRETPEPDVPRDYFT